MVSMKNIQEKSLQILEKSLENCTDSHGTIFWVFQFNTQSVVIFIEFLVETTST